MKAKRIFIAEERCGKSNFFTTHRGYTKRYITVIIHSIKQDLHVRDVYKNPVTVWLILKSWRVYFRLVFIRWMGLPPRPPVAAGETTHFDLNWKRVQLGFTTMSLFISWPCTRLWLVQGGSHDVIKPFWFAFSLYIAFIFTCRPTCSSFFPMQWDENTCISSFCIISMSLLNEIFISTHMFKIWCVNLVIPS